MLSFFVDFVLFSGQLLGCLLLLSAMRCTGADSQAKKDLSLPQLTALHTVTTVPMTNDGNLQWRVLVLVDDLPGLFALDSGSEQTLISPEFAKKIGALPFSYERDGKIVPPKNNSVASASIRSLQMGDFLYTGFYAPVADMEHLNRSMHTKIDGILGNNILGLSRCEFDWRKNILTLNSTVSLRPTNAISAKVVRQRLFIPAKFKGHDVELGVDTGSYSTCITHKTLRRLKVPPSDIAFVESPKIDIKDAKWLKQSRVTLDTLEFCGMTRHRDTVMTWDHDVLGMDELQRWILTFDVRGGWVALTDF